MEPKFQIGQLVSTKISANPFMPGIGEIIGISLLGMLKDGKKQYLYTCECNGINYHYSEDDIYEYEIY